MPGRLRVDKDYDFAHYRRYRRQSGIIVCIAHRGVQSKKRPGLHRWIIEHTHAWFAGFGELDVRFERRLDIPVASRSLAAAVICSRLIDDLR
jgi:hypothetical protein